MVAGEEKRRAKLELELELELVLAPSHAPSRCTSLLSITPVSGPNYLTPEEVIARYRGQLSEGTLCNWRCMHIGPSFLKIGKAILYPSSELDRWDKSILVVWPTRKLPFEKAAPPQ